MSSRLVSFLMVLCRDFGVAGEKGITIDLRLSRVYESGEEITVALLRENSLFGVLSLLTGHRSDRFYHAIAFTRVEMITAPANSVLRAIEEDASVGLLLLQGLSSRILQTETMIETLTHRDMSSRLVSFLMVLCRDFGVAGEKGITIDPVSYTHLTLPTIGCV